MDNNAKMIILLWEDIKHFSAQEMDIQDIAEELSRRYRVMFMAEEDVDNV